MPCGNAPPSTTLEALALVRLPSVAVDLPHTGPAHPFCIRRLPACPRLFDPPLTRGLVQSNLRFSKPRWMGYPWVANC
jgi:hypothetical protein